MEDELLIVDGANFRENFKGSYRSRAKLHELEFFQQLVEATK